MTLGNEFVGKNRDLWNKRVRAHLREGLYPSTAVEAGTYTVGLPDRLDVGDVNRRRLLHLQCNAGADTPANATSPTSAMRASAPAAHTDR